MRRVLITGITGFAGSHLAERLVERGDEVHGIVNEPPPFPTLSRVSAQVTTYDADVLDAHAIRAVIERTRPHVVFHLAGQAVPTLASADPLAAIRVNVLGTANVVAAARGAAGVHLVVASSADVYGIPDAVPSNEDVPLHPTNVYAATKVAAEAIARANADASGTILRPCNQIGPRLHPRLVASEFAKRIAEAEAGLVDPVVLHGQLDPRREFLDVRDMAAAYDAAADLRDAGPATYNVGSGTAVSVADILDVLRGLARIPIRAELDPERVRAGVPSVLLLDSTRFRERTGWAPSIPLERSLSDTLDYWREQVTRAERTDDTPRILRDPRGPQVRPRARSES
jgi:GDP-4-dehydro-6-deoxy-D-mannose reductase